MSLSQKGGLESAGVSTGSAPTFDDITLTGNDLTASGTAQTFNIVSATAATTVSPTVAAVTIAPSATLDANDLVLDVKAVSGGTSIFTVDKEGDAVHAGSLVTNGTALITGNVTLSSGFIFGGSGTPVTVSGQVANSATAVQTRIGDWGNNYSTPGSQIVQIMNNGGRVADFSYQGFLSSAAPHPSLGRRFGRYAPAASAATTYTVDNLPAVTYSAAETASAAPAPTGGTRRFIQHASSAVINTDGGIIGPFTATRPLYRPKMSTVTLTDTAITLRRVWIGLTESSLSALAHLVGTAASAIDFVAVGFDTSVNANWLICSGDGTNYSCASTGVAVVGNTEYRIDIDWTTVGTLRVVINGTGVNKSTNLSTVAAELGIQHTVTSLEALTSKSTFIASVCLEQN